MGRILGWGLLIATPVVLTLMERRRVLAAPLDEREAAWFRHWRFLQWISTGTVLVWITVFPAFGTWELGRSAFGDRPLWVWRLVFFSVLFLVPAAVATVCQLLSLPVFELLERRESARYQMRWAAWGSILTIVPTIGLLVSFLTFFETPRVAALLLVAALATYLLGATALQREHDMTPEAVTTGELRDRVFALAEQLGVKLRQLYVVPALRMRMANAFAASGGNVILTDYLIRRMSRRELDAILAHELAHLKHRHPGWLSVALFGPVAVFATAAALLLPRLPLLGKFGFWEALPFGLIPGMLGFLALSRRFEHAADATAVRTTKEPEALITALARLTRGAVLPRRWGRWTRWIVTHPSLEERAQRIVEASPVAIGPVAALLDPPAVGESYPLPAAARSEQRVYTTRVRTTSSLRVSLVALLTPIFVTLLVALSARSFGLSGPERWLAWLVGIALGVGLTHLASQRAGVWGYAGMRRRLADQLRQRGVDPAQGVFVGFAPDAIPRLYEGSSDWDVGFLFLEAERLVYLGDQLSFGLARDAVRSVRMGRGLPGWRAERRCYVVAEAGGERTFSMLVAEAPSVAVSRVATTALVDRLQSWRRNGQGADELTLVGLELGPPTIGAVSSTALSAHAGLSATLGTAFFFAAMGLVAGLLFGLDFSFGTRMDGIYPGLATGLIFVLLQLPVVSYQEPKSSARGLASAPNDPGSPETPPTPSSG